MPFRTRSSRRMGTRAFPIRFLEGGAVDAMAVTDGGTIHALVHVGGRIVRLNGATGRIVGEVPGEGYDRLAAVVPW